MTPSTVFVCENVYVCVCVWTYVCLQQIYISKYGNIEQGILKQETTFFLQLIFNLLKMD